MNLHFPHSQKGSLLLVGIMLVAVVLVVVMAILGYTNSQIASHRTAVSKVQAIDIAEAGVEAALWKLNHQANYTGESNTSYGSGAYTVAVTTVSSTVKNISVTASVPASNPVVSKTLKIVAGIDLSGASFYYGIAAGDGGLQDNGIVHGNVFSSGPITGAGTIDNDVILSSKADGTINSITGVYVGGNVLAHNCVAPASVNKLTYVTGGIHTCTIRSGIPPVEQPGEISSQPMPIPQTDIDSWKDVAIAGGVFTGTKNITTSQTLGPLEITGDLNVNSGATLTLAGTVYVMGNITVDGQNTQINLSSSYGSSGGVLITNGLFTVNHPNITLTGSGATGSYLLVLSTNTSDTAIWIKNNLAGHTAFYTSAGGITLTNGVSVVEASGYKIILGNGSVVQYSTGVINIYFSSGPGGSWEFVRGSYQSQ